MQSLSEIEAAISQLSDLEVRQLSDWLQAYLEERWDRQIEADFKSGRLNSLIQQAKADIAANQVKPLGH